MSYLPEFTTPYKEINTLISDDAEKGLAKVNEYIADNPDTENGYLLLARAHRIKKDHSTANVVLNKLIARAPSNMLARVELAKNFSQQKDYKSAIVTFKQALNISPEYHEIWSMLAQLYFDQGNKVEAQNALAQFDMIKAFNDSLYKAQKEFNLKNYSIAEQECRRLLTKVPNEIRVLRLLAQISTKLGHAEVAASILKYCLSAKPNDSDIAIEYAQSLLNAKQYMQASSLCTSLLKVQQKNITLFGVLAEAQVKMGAYEAALGTYQSVQTLYPDNALILLRYGNVLKIIGKSAEAIASYKKAIALNPGLGEAYWNLSNLKTYSFTSDEIVIMRRELEKDLLMPLDKMLVCFALGKVYEDSGEYSKSFHYYQIGNNANQVKQPIGNTKYLNSVMSFFTQDYFSKQKAHGHSTDEPIFIVGLPRSGSTLVEQILSSHSMVDGTMELTEMVTIARQLNQKNQQRKEQYPELLAQLEPAAINALGEQYLKNISAMRGNGRYFIDKLPNNFNHIGLIKTIFPNAKIIDVRRQPMACGWSLYKHYFAQGHEFSYDLTSIGHYYNDYIKLMTHWHTVLPDQILTINYEDLIVDFEATVKKILSYCDIQFESSCLSFYNNKRPVATASSEQVRQPIYQKALEHWKNYEEFLTPLANVVSD